MTQKHAQASKKKRGQGHWIGQDPAWPLERAHATPKQTPEQKRANEEQARMIEAVLRARS